MKSGRKTTIYQGIAAHGFVAVVSLCVVMSAAMSVVWAQADPTAPMNSQQLEMGADSEVDVQISTDDDDQGLEGQPIASYELRCDLELCRDRSAVERFKNISGLKVGQPYRAQDLERAQMRLAKTGFFQKLQIDRRLEADGVAIDIEAQGAVLIRRLRFEGLNPPPFESELRKVLMYRSGQVFRDDQEQAMAQLQSLESMFEQEGYFGTRIVMRPVSVDGEPHLVDLIFEIERGERRNICGLAFRGVRGMTTAEARELMLTGVSVIGRRIPLFLPTFTTDQFRRGREALIEEYRRRGYFRARIVDQAIQIDERSNCTQLIVDVNEGPFWDIEFHGNDSLSDNRLREQMPFGRSGYVDDHEIEVAKNSVRKAYEAQGYPFAQVSGSEEVEDRLDRRLVFTVEEGPRVQIESIRFYGVEAFEQAQARQGFGTQPYGLLDTGGFLQTEQLLADFLSLERRYRQAGYMHAIVERFVVELNDRGDGIRIRIYVDEGPQTTVESVEIRGHRVASASELRQRLELTEGIAFEPLKLQADQSRLTQHYGSIGYPRANAESTCFDTDGHEVACGAPELPEGCRYSNFEELVERGCQWRESATPTWVCDRIVDDDRCEFEGGVVDEQVRVRHDIREGPRVEVGEILLKGNFRTRSGIIFRELGLESGDVLNVQKLIEGQGNMRSLGLFNSVSIETIGLDNDDRTPGGQATQGDGDWGDDEDDQVASLIVSVEESRSRFLDFRFGLEGRDVIGDSRRLLATGELQYSDNNLFGTGQRFRPRLIAATDSFEVLRYGTDTTRDIDVAPEVTDLDYLLGAELIYNHPRFLRSQLGVDELVLTVTPFYLVDLLGVSRTDRAQVLREEWGLRMELRKELFELLERFYLKLGIEAKQTATWATGDLRIGGERIFSPRRATGKLMPELTLDRRDSPLNPRQGYHLQLQPELVSGDALDQDGQEMVGDSYWRLSFSASYFWSIVDDLVLGQGIRAGQIIPLFDRQTLVPLDERFYLGGAGSVRGFAANSMGPIGTSQQPTGGEFVVNYSAEIRYPLLDGWGLYGATFFDAGLLVDCFDEDGDRASGQCYDNAFPDDAPLSQVRTTAGLGLRYLLVDQIPLLLDYGMVLNRRPGESFGALHFNLGYTF